jgi:hypothetical protein
MTFYEWRGCPEIVEYFGFIGTPLFIRLFLEKSRFGGEGLKNILGDH